MHEAHRQENAAHDVCWTMQFTCVGTLRITLSMRPLGSSPQKREKAEHVAMRQITETGADPFKSVYQTALSMKPDDCEPRDRISNLRSQRVYQMRNEPWRMIDELGPNASLCGGDCSSFAACVKGPEELARLPSLSRAGITLSQFCLRRRGIISVAHNANLLKLCQSY